MILKLESPYKIANLGKGALLVSKDDLDQLKDISTQAQIWHPSTGYSEVRPLQIHLKFLYEVEEVDPPVSWEAPRGD